MSNKAHYIMEGKGEPILFLHGWGCDGEIMHKFARETDRLYRELGIKTRAPLHFKEKALKVQRNHTVIKTGVKGKLFKKSGICSILPDLWGFGRSMAPHSGCGISEYADMVAQLMREQKHLTKTGQTSEERPESKRNEFNLVPTLIVAHSFGARIAIVLAAKYPELVGGLVIIGGAGLRRFSLKRTVKVFKYKVLKFAVKLRFVDKESLSRHGSSDYKALKGVMKQVFLNVIREDLTIYAKRVKCRTLLIYGSLDTETPLWIAKKYNRLIVNSELKIINKAGHFVFIEKEYETACLTARFIAETQRAGSKIMSNADEDN